jgi:hypothetical protein
LADCRARAPPAADQNQNQNETERQRGRKREREREREREGREESKGGGTARADPSPETQHARLVAGTPRLKHFALRLSGAARIAALEERHWHEEFDPSSFAVQQLVWPNG